MWFRNFPQQSQATRVFEKRGWLRITTFPEELKSLARTMPSDPLKRLFWARSRAEKMHVMTLCFCECRAILYQSNNNYPSVMFTRYFNFNSIWVQTEKELQNDTYDLRWESEEDMVRYCDSRSLYTVGPGFSAWNVAAKASCSSVPSIVLLSRQIHLGIIVKSKSESQEITGNSQ